MRGGERRQQIYRETRNPSELSADANAAGHRPKEAERMRKVDLAEQGENLFESCIQRQAPIAGYYQLQIDLSSRS